MSTLITVFVLAITAFLIFVMPELTRREECPLHLHPATEQDIAQAISIGENVFEPDQWELQYGEQQGLISVLWLNHDKG